MNQMWPYPVLIAHDLMSWTRTLLLDGELAEACPKRLRYRLLHTAGRLAFHGRSSTTTPTRTWPCG